MQILLKTVCNLLYLIRKKITKSLQVYKEKDYLQNKSKYIYRINDIQNFIMLNNCYPSKSFKDFKFHLKVIQMT